MEELFVENFFKQHQHERTTFGLAESSLKEKINVENLTVSQDSQKSDQKNSDLLLDLAIFLDRLEKEVEVNYADFADYRVIFNKIRTIIKQNSVEGIIEILDHLEELLDLGIPSLIMKKNLNQKQ